MSDYDVFAPTTVLSQDVPAWLMREYLDSYSAWRDESADVQGAYERWAASQDADAATAFVAYRAALDREERAAIELCGWAERISGRKDPHAAM
ncbi:hypothetical protein OM076_03210 [Solirubrobacter ginsenosidimutans]|uniref:Uncharacterized protein n=1 Tax=Solirubrobacter ginsenosidimutans TaxID=490573 RepID=A0A9X3MT98_9ACTN|nr:hypothetical protein [Solirubrobacter ginsenosidimutans]MDA0159263.1 hypothetical protein [Solirubrobacter ginsenosidimutans]